MSDSICVSLLLLAAMTAIYGCATPTSPTGGEPDKEGPTILYVSPEPGTVNFSGSRIELGFSEFVERRSLREAIVIEPDIGLEYEIDWGRKSAAIEFKSKLPDTTTVLVAIGTELSDTRGNEMSEPIRIAVSTGPEIDEGEITGKIVDSETGKGDSGDRVLLYRTPYDLTSKADYIAQTDTSGQFNFTYLRQGTYKIFWVNDQNRSKIWEQEREQAQPFYRETITLAKGGRDTLKTIFKAPTDTTSPNLQGVGLFSEQRMRLRFSENIELTDSTRIAITDTLGEPFSEAQPLYLIPAEQYVLFAQSAEPLAEEAFYRAEVFHVSDGAGNYRRRAVMQFEGSAQEDTTQQRIIKRENEKGLFPDEPLEITYAKPITEPEVQDSLQVVDGDTLISDWPNTGIRLNRLLVGPRETWLQGLDYEIQAWDPIVGQRRSYPLTVWHTPDYGGIQFTLEDSTDTAEYRIRISTPGRGVIRDTTFSGSVEIENLPPVSYKAEIFEDRNGNGEWDAGSVIPYRAPEPYFIRPKLPVKDSFVSEVSVSF